MMMKLLAVLALLAPAAAAATDISTGNANEMVCRVTGETGSRLQRTRTCRTRAEWDQLRREQRSTIDRAQTRQVNRTIDETGKTH
jgi:hypothetical protein